ncbi:MAG: alpha/beta fold hydrolase [Proteobacteria bacterium]|nr:alpha/beta fold hydrolase [Pseudomonadota bacterium]
MTATTDFAPPRWLRGRHVQSILSSSGLRRRAGARALTRLRAQHDEHLLDGGDGVRLHGIHSHLARPPRGLVLLLHGWEGSVQSGYMLHTAATLLAAGFDVFRLNFRDHGDSHHLNVDPFHSCRIGEVVNAARSLTQIIPTSPLLVAGFSLGGNFALRLALHAPRAGIALAHAAAVCPVVDPAAGLRALETGPPLYHWYFMRKWRGSLRRKRALFPQRHDFDDAVLAQDMRALTAWMVGRYTDMGALENYLDGYSIADERLAGLRVPVSILAARDDPVIPIADFHRLQLPAHSRLDVAAFGGHCGFLEGAALRGYGERWITARLLAASAVPA